MLLSIGTLTKNKDFANLIRTASLVTKKHNNLKFVIVGDGPEKQNLLKLAKKLKVSSFIKHLPTVGYQDLPKLYKNADIYILPSSQEGLPRVLMEASLASTPIVTTNIYGARDIVTHNKSGLIVPAKSPTKLAKAITKALDDLSKMNNYANKAHSEAVKYLDFDKNVNKLINSWKALSS